jgi:hypothetical protein
VEGESPRRKFRSLEWQLGLSAHIDAKELSRGLATQPPDRPPDPENESPGTVETATGAEVQRSVLARTVPKYRNAEALVQSAAFDVYEGRDRVGSAVELDVRHYANTVGGEVIGVFRSRVEAVPATSAKGSAS